MDFMMPIFYFFITVVGIILVLIFCFFIFLVLDNLEEQIAVNVISVFIIIAFFVIVSSVYWLSYL